MSKKWKPYRQPTCVWAPLYDDNKDDVLAAMCHNGEAYSSLQMNREDAEYIQKLTIEGMDWHQVLSIPE